MQLIKLADWQQILRFPAFESIEESWQVVLPEAIDMFPSRS